MKKPIILITGGPAFDKKYNLESRMLNATYPSAVSNAGGIPILELDNNAQDEYLEMVDGIIFTGTHFYTFDPANDFCPTYLERLDRESEFIKKAIATKKPIYGICQGCHLINEVLGGEIIKFFKREEGVEHYNFPHPVKSTKDSILNKLFGDEFMVNSFHHYKIGKLAPCLKVTALSEDNVIEAYEHESLPVYGFQFHPERMIGDFHDTPTGPDAIELFKYFVDLCRK